MRKLKLQVQISIDGFVSTGDNDEQKWVTWAFDEIRPEVMGLLDGSDTILIGRKLAVDYIPYWEDVNEQPDHPMFETATKIVKAKKVVFSKTLQESQWNNTVVANGDLVAEVTQVKKEPGKDIMVYGGSSFVSALIAENLIDDFYLFVNPVALANGGSIFHKLSAYKQMKLKATKIYNSGIVLLHYQPA